MFTRVVLVLLVSVVDLFVGFGAFGLMFWVFCASSVGSLTRGFIFHELFLDLGLVYGVFCGFC